MKCTIVSYAYGEERGGIKMDKGLMKLYRVLVIVNILWIIGMIVLIGAIL